MCTLSYLPEGSLRWIFFNRDESRQKARTGAPALFRTAKGNYFMPLDPESGGSWMGLHSAGFFICLLNNYPGDQNIHGPEYRSRGLLIRDILNLGVFPNAALLQEALARHSYAPFFLATFSWSRTGLWEWDGQGFRELPAAAGAGMLTSSAFQHERISARRGLRFQALRRHTKATLRRFHRNRGGGCREEGILMSREEACTLSISEVCLRGRSASIRYYASEPFMWGRTSTLSFTA